MEVDGLIGERCGIGILVVEGCLVVEDGDGGCELFRGML